VKLKVIDGGISCRPADGRGRYPVRGLHLIDIENLVGCGLPSLAQIRGVQDGYAERLIFGTLDQVVIASSRLTLVNAGVGWPNARYRARSGRDGADSELLDVLWNERVAERFARVVIGSGDGAFAAAAVSLTGAGVRVTVVSLRDHLSGRLKQAASEVIYLDDAPPPESVAA
jgi:NYN domain